jgi:hypothetical protein
MRVLLQAALKRAGAPVEDAPRDGNRERPVHAMESGNASDTGASVPAAGTPRRGSYRTRAEIPAVLFRVDAGATAGWLRCWLRDLSTSGASIEGTLELGVGDPVQLRFGKPHELLTLEAIVVRGDAEPRVFALRFETHDEAVSESLYRFVMELAQEYVQYRSRHLSWEPEHDADTALGDDLSIHR